MFCVPKHDSQNNLFQFEFLVVCNEKDNSADPS